MAFQRHYIRTVYRVVFNQYAGQSERPKTVIANAMFLQDKYQVKPNFKNTLIDRYKTDIFSVDFLQPQHASDRYYTFYTSASFEVRQNASIRDTSTIVCLRNRNSFILLTA